MSSHRRAALVAVLGALLALVGTVTVLTGASSATPNVQKVPVCYASGWDLSDSAPFNSEITAEQFTHTGLELHVTGPSQKQSAYVTLSQPVKLESVNQSDTGLTYEVDHGFAPAYQLTVLAEPTTPPAADGWLGNLVHENGKWWATRPQHWSMIPDAAQSAGGTTLDVYRAAYPGRLVYRVGFSLGSGAAASAGVLKNMTFQGTLWQFRRVCSESLPTSYTTTRVPTSSTAPSTTAPTSLPSTTTAETTSPPPNATTTVRYASCDAASRAHAAPLNWNQPGYRPPLDRDGDGIACEPDERTRDDGVRRASDDDLASTGASVGPLVVTGAGALLVGIALVLVLRARRREEG